MTDDYVIFWRLYAPPVEFGNRYQACRRLWLTMDASTRRQIISQLQREQQAERSPPHTKNPYFFLTDWRPPQPQWLTPRETTRLMQQRIPLAVCLNPQTQTYQTCTRAEAEQFGLCVHHYM